MLPSARTFVAAAVLVAAAALGGGIVGQVTGAGAGGSSGTRSVTEAINPIRILETRGPGDGGPTGQPTAAPLGQGKTLTLQVSGATGQGGATVQTGLTGAVLNVTAVNATAPTFLKLYPCDGTIPATSTLNPTPGQISFNSATVKLSATGTVCIFNNTGSVDVIVDVTAVQYDHNHDDRYYTKTEINTALQATGTLKLDAADFHISSGVPIWLSNADVWSADDTVNDGCVVTPVDLPNGAVLTEVRVYVNESIDSGDPVDISAQLERSKFGVNGQGAVIGNRTNDHAPTTKGTDDSFSIPAAVGHVIDATFDYALEVCLGPAVSPNNNWDALMDARITYTGGNALPVIP
jgi:hypothetical protein